VAARSLSLPATGYYISRDDGDHLVIDGGPHGYMNAGHAHADALSLTFSRHGKPLLIDTGTGCYTVNPETRDRFRSTALHNTLALNGRSQSIARGPFHWQHMANGSTRRWHTTRRFDYFAGTHDGYLPLVHARYILMLHRDVLIVADCVAGLSTASKAHRKAPKAEAAVHWHLDPTWAVTLDQGHAVMRAGDESVELCVAGGGLEHFHGDDATGLGWHAPVYGYTEPTSSLRISSEAAVPLWIVSVFGLDPGNRVQAVRLDPAPRSRACHDAAAIRIDRHGSTDRLIVAEPIDATGDRRWWSDGVQSDAAMVFTREIGARIAALALVDATTLRVEGEPAFDRTFSSRVGDVYMTADDAPAGAPLARPTTEQRKATECAESPGSLMVRQ
jgi:hypothetical protein